MIVLGSQFGDEGKGLTTSFLCSVTKNPLVVRFNGGHQAGHTVVYNGERHVFSSYGSGTLQNAPTYWSKYCTFSPIGALNEYDILKNNSLNSDPILYVNPLAPVTTPYDNWFNQHSEKQNKHGSVGVGFGATIQRQEDHYNLFVQDLFHERILLEKLTNIRNYYNKKNVLPDEVLQFVDLAEFFNSVCEIRKIIRLTGDEILSSYTPIFEGAQGILLDQDFGFFPNVTRSHTTSKNALEIARDREEQEIYYVTRTYQTRHGNGFMTNENMPPHLINNDNETNKYCEFQGRFRTGKLDTDLLNYALQCDDHYSKGLKKNLVITCMDQLQIDPHRLLKELNTSFDKVFISKGDSYKTISRFI